MPHRIEKIVPDKELIIIVDTVILLIFTNCDYYQHHGHHQRDYDYHHGHNHELF